MRWSEDKLREYGEKRAKSAAVARSEVGTPVGSLPGIPDAPEPIAPARRARPFRLTAVEPLEGDVQGAIRALLAVHPLVAWHMRINSGVSTPIDADGRRRFIRFHDMPGCSDLIGQLADGRFLAIEVKRPSWRRPSDEREEAQAAFIERVRAGAGVAFFARSTADVLEHLGPLG